MRKTRIALLFMILLSSFSFAQSPESEILCEHSFEISGPMNLVQGQLGEYNISFEGTGELNENIEYEYVLSKDEKTINKVNSKNYFNNFDEIGIYQLNIEIKDEECIYNTGQEIKVYTKSILFMGDDDSIIEPYNNSFEENSILFHKAVITDPSFLDGNNVVSMWRKELKQSDLILIKSNDLETIFQDMIWFSESADIDLSSKKILVISDSNRNLIKRISSKYIKSVNERGIYLLDNESFVSLLSIASMDQDIWNSEYLKVYPLSLEETSKIWIISYLSDILIYNGFPISLIAILLTTAIAVLAITIFRQVIGFDIFGSYTPLIFGLAVSFVGFRLGLILFAIALLSTVLVRLFTKKLYLLHSAKVALLISVYFVFTVGILGVIYLLYPNLIDIQIFNNAFIIFPMIMFLMSTEKLFYEGVNIRSKQWLLSIIEFAIVSYIVILIVDSTILKNLMLSYPELIILIIVGIIIVGRFTGLQLLEYFRFLPLFKSDGDEE